MEGAFRWRDEKSIPHVDLCRPFAAHWYVFTVFVFVIQCNAHITDFIHLSFAYALVSDIQLLHWALASKATLAIEFVIANNVK